mmetsp:Transcript_22459/g.36940  ORF Transcript_22459/g.36940 Transcript_22459/m.36940 type:complete len:120 (-) Transcript_22459:7776-8135(-)
MWHVRRSYANFVISSSTFSLVNCTQKHSKVHLQPHSLWQQNFRKFSSSSSFPCTSSPFSSTLSLPPTSSFFLGGSENLAFAQAVAHKTANSCVLYTPHWDAIFAMTLRLENMSSPTFCP